MVLLVLFLLVRGYFTIAVRKARKKAQEDVHAASREGRVNLLLRRLVLTPLLGMSLYLYFIEHEWSTPFNVPYQQPVMWIGAVLGLCGIGVLIWVHMFLGKEWSARLRLNKEHRLIQSGPYGYVRHPMYTALFTIYFSFGLIAANYLVILILSMLIMSVALRLPMEEQMLIERFGDEYRTYQSRTGRFFPKL